MPILQINEPRDTIARQRGDYDFFLCQKGHILQMCASGGGGRGLLPPTSSQWLSTPIHKAADGVNQSIKLSVSVRCRVHTQLHGHGEGAERLKPSVVFPWLHCNCRLLSSYTEYWGCKPLAISENSNPELRLNRLKLFDIVNPHSTILTL